jgi:quercetin dioxygenase-like cupin family protein
MPPGRLLSSSSRVALGAFAAAIALVVAVTTALVATAAAKGDPVTRAVLGEAAPANSPGQDLTLQRVTVQPDAKLPTHYHEGTQVAYVEAGVLTYTVESGTLELTRKGAAKPTDVTGPATVKLAAGDGIVEAATVVHHAENKGAKPVVIVLAALLRNGAPLATPVGTDTTGTTNVKMQTLLVSQSRTLHSAGAAGSITYGWNMLAGTSAVNAQPVALEMLASVDYVSGSGPFSGFVTFTFADGSTLAVRMQGLATANADGTVTTFSSTLGVVGGTGTYASAAGSGTFTGERRTALGGNVDATFDLQLAK